MLKKSKTPRKLTRSKDVGPISISLSEGLLAKIDAMAKAERRNRSNFITHALKLAAARAEI